MHRRKVQRLSWMLCVASGLLLVVSAVSAQTLQLSRRSDFSTADGIFSFADTLHARVRAANINYLDLEKNEFRLHADSGGYQVEGAFFNNFNGTYDAHIPLSGLHRNQRWWRFRAEIRDRSNGEFKTEVPLTIEAMPGVGDTLVVTARIEAIGTNFLTLSGQTIFADNGTAVLEPSGVALLFQDLRKDWKVQVLAERRNDNRLWAKLILVLERSAEFEIETQGYIASIQGMAVTVNNIRFMVTSATEIRDRAGNLTTIAALRIGMLVEAKGKRNANGEVTALRLTIKDENTGGHEIELTGHITALIDSFPRYIVVTNTAFEVNNATEILGFDNEPIRFTDLRAGEIVEVKGRTRPNNPPIAERIKRESNNGDEVEVRGLISHLTNASLTVNGFEFKVLASTVILDQANNFITFGDLRTGMLVEVRGDRLADGALAATRIQIESNTNREIEIKGFIDRLTDNSVTVLGVTFSVDDATVVLDENNVRTSFSTLRTGMLVEVKGFATAAGVLYAGRIKIEDFNRDEIELRGLITALNTAERFIDVAGLRFFVTAATEIIGKNGELLPFEALQTGMVVEVRARLDGGRWVASRIHVEDRIDPILEIFGQIESLNRDSLNTFTLFGRTFLVTNTTVFLDRDNQPITFDDLNVGDFVEVRAQLAPSGTLVALRVKLRNSPNNDEFEFTGSINLLSFNVIRVDAFEFLVNAATVYLGADEQPITIEDLHLGMTVQVTAKRQANGALTALRVKVEDRRALAGIITQVSGNTLFVQGLPHVITANSLILDTQNRPSALTSLQVNQQVELVAQSNQSQLEIVTLRVVSGIVTGVDDNHQPQASPQTFALSQNYPNPFNPSTVIRFALPQAGSVRLAVYNILGRRIRTLMEGVRPAGDYQVTWDSRDDSGNLVASGIYFYRLESNGLTQTRKLTLMR